MPEPSFDETRSLILSARDGDEAAAGALFERYRPWVMQVVALRLGSPLRELHECEDVAQEALADAFRGLDRFDHRTEGSFRHWLATIVQRRISDHWRRAQSRKRGDGRVRPFAAYASSVLSASLLPGDATTPSERLAARELEGRIEDALLALDERDRRIIELRRLCGLSYAEVTAELGFESEGAARACLARALAKLSSRL